LNYFAGSRLYFPSINIEGNTTEGIGFSLSTEFKGCESALQNNFAFCGVPVLALVGFGFMSVETDFAGV
jgi:hypothetical protein